MSQLPLFPDNLLVMKRDGVCFDAIQGLENKLREYQTHPDLPSLQNIVIIAEFEDSREIGIVGNPATVERAVFLMEWGIRFYVK